MRRLLRLAVARLVTAPSRWVLRHHTPVHIDGHTACDPRAHRGQLVEWPCRVWEETGEALDVTWARYAPEGTDWRELEWSR